MFRKIKNLLIFICLLAAVFTVAHFALALDVGLDQAAGTGLSVVDPRIIAANIIRIALGFLGIIAVCLIIYAGFLWMTAGGEAEKVEKAKKILTEAIIGLIIILASFAIASFVLNALIGATGGDGSSGICDPACVSGQNCCYGVCTSDPCVPPPNPNHSLTSSIYPSGEWSVPLNGTGGVRFNNQIEPGVGDFTVNSIDKPNGTVGALITNQISTTADSNIINYQPKATCAQVKTDFPKAGIIIPAGHEDDKCFRPDMIKDDLYGDGSGYRIQVDNYKTIGGTSLTCFGNACVTDFSASPILDITPPTISFDYRAMCVNTSNTLSAWINDDWGVKEASFTVDSNAPITSAPTTQTRNFYAQATTNTITKLGDHTVKVKATDIANNEATLEKTIKAWPSHCCNGTKDVDETEVDCGGSCAACDGSRCDKASAPTTCDNNLCASQFCTATLSNTTDPKECEAAGYAVGTTNCCLCQRQPVITGIFPVGGFCDGSPNTACLENKNCTTGLKTCNKVVPNGAAGNFVTIVGRNFGEDAGKVYFTSGDDKQDLEAKLANDQATGNVLCKNSWTNTQIIAIAPKDFFKGPVKITTSSGFSDDSRKNPDLLDFIDSGFSRPGICQLTPTEGVIDTTINYSGIKLSGNKAYFGDWSASTTAIGLPFAGDKQGNAQVSNIQTGRTTSFVAKGLVFSNYLNFTKDAEPYSGPIISSFDPKQGSAGQYVTIHGRGFGAVRGVNLDPKQSHVYFGGTIDGEGNVVGGTEASYVFPVICADSIWSDKQVIVKVPDNGLVGNKTTPGNYKITMKVGTWRAVDTEFLIPKTFSFDKDEPLKPSLCKIEPIIGKANSQVSLWGEYFGSFDETYSKIRFQLNHDQSGKTTGDKKIVSWERDNSATGNLKPDKAVTTVHQQAVTGPVKAVKSTSPELVGNGLNFTVGICKTADDCGANSLCCSAGTPYASQCKKFDTGKKTEQDLCFPEIKSCVYEWKFTTLGAPQCLATQKICGRSCCNPNDKCDENYNYGTGKCDNIICPNGITCDKECCSADVAKCDKKSGNCPKVEGDPCYNGGTPGNCDKNKDECDSSLICDLTDCICKKACNKNTVGIKTCEVDSAKCTNPLMLNCDSRTCLCNKSAVTSCSGYGDQCASAGFCPNSYGQCSAPPAGSTVQTGSCDNNSCNNFTACKKNLCEYKPILNQCARKNLSCALSRVITYRLGSDPTKFTGTASCLPYASSPSPSPSPAPSSGSRWIMTVNTSCPDGWTNIGGKRCLEDSPDCSVCAPGFKCLKETPKATDGVCVIDQPVCPAGSTCKDGECQKDNAGCDCCCRKANANQDCCVPLKCQGTCGSDTTDDNVGFGQCTGCANIGGDQEAHNNACNCSGASGKYCDDSINSNGVCKDCAQLSTAGSCTDKGIGTCCVDAMKGNVCSGGTGVYGISQSIPDYRYCSYYKCKAGNDGCDAVKPVASSTVAVYPDTAQCDAACVYTQPPQFGQTCAAYVTAQPSCEVNKCINFNCLDRDGYGVGSPHNPANYVPSAIDKTCGTCCCDPNAKDSNGVSINQCATSLNPKLKCQADRGECFGAGRGLCCGCSKDSECGKGNSIGCGSDACCQARPSVVFVLPANGAAKVCRNSLIKATFDQPMQINTFIGNVIVAGDYKNEQCPAGTQYLTAVYKPTRLAKINSWLAKLPLINKLFTADARAEVLAGNFCAVAGSASGYNKTNGQVVQTVLEFKLQKLLEPGRKYYVIIKGDSDINDAINNGVLSQAGIGLNPADNSTFNGVAYKGKIWSFTTRNDSDANKGICEIASVEIDPLSYLFQTNKDDTSDNAAGNKFNTIDDSDLVYRAIARAKDGTALNSLAGVYSWDWDWTSSNSDVFKLSSDGGLLIKGDKQLIRASDKFKVGESVITATATMNAGGGGPYSATANAYLMVCANPWPKVDPNNHTWAPWGDNNLVCFINNLPSGNCPEGSSVDDDCGPSGAGGKCQKNCTAQKTDCNDTNYEISYCRDAGGPGTADDLPAIFSDSAVIRGQSTNLKCSDNKGDCSGVGKTVDDNCGPGAGVLKCSDVSGTCGGSAQKNTPCGGGTCKFEISCQIDILKELYFFREDLPSTSGTFKVTALARGGAVSVTWDKVTDTPVTGYKIYYGTTSGAYPYSVATSTVGTVASPQIITGLTNGRAYYFAITSYNAQKAESALSVFRDADVVPSDSVTPRDIQAPMVPQGIWSTATTSSITLNWAANTDDTASYKVYYGASSNYGASVSLAKSKCSAGACAIKISGLNLNATYHFSVTALDAQMPPNESAKAADFSFNMKIITDQANCLTNLEQIKNAIIAKRLETGKYLKEITGDFCSACLCSPPDEGKGLRSQECSDQMAKTFKALGFSGLLKDPWGDPYLINENEHENIPEDPSCSPCDQDDVYSLHCNSDHVPLFN